MLRIIAGLIISYLIGSIPTAYIFARVIKGVDIRKFGSGNVGATNAFRLLGKWPGIIVLFLDVLKGFLVVTVIGNFIPPKGAVFTAGTWRMLLGLTCISGHNWSIFLNFQGGKGIAATLGVLLGLAITVSGLKSVLGSTILTWVLVFAISRIVSLASICASISLPIYMILFKQPPASIALTFILSLFVIIRHKSNIQRLLEGKERRLF